MQAPENKGLTKPDKTDVLDNSENLAQFLLSKVESDPDLKQIIERWPELSVELRAAISELEVDEEEQK